jgi:hypothetical protein
VENGDLLNVFCGRTGREGRSSNERWVLLVEKKDPDEIIEVELTNVFPECLE